MKILVSLILGVMFVATASLSRAEILLQNPGGSYSPLASISAANTSAQVVGRTVVITSPYTISTDTVLRGDCTWKFVKGGLITIASGKTLTFQSQPQIPDGVQAFAGTGAVAGITEARPEWWGASGSSGGTGSSANTAAFQSAINSLTNGGILRISVGQYYINDTLSITTPIDIIGAGYSRTADGFLDVNGKGSILLYNGADGKPTIYVNGTTDTIDGVHLSGFALSDTTSNSTGTIGIQANTVRHSSFRDIFIERYYTAFKGMAKVYQNTFDNVAAYTFNYGFYLDSESEDNTFLNCLLRGYRNGSVGVVENYYCQKNVFIGCDFSNNNKGFRSLLSLGNNTTTLISCAFELGGDGAESNMTTTQIGVEMQNSTSIFTALRLIGCRFLYTGVDGTKKAAAVAVNLVSGSVLELIDTTVSSIGNGIVVANASNFSKLVLRNNTWPSVTTPMNAEALKVAIEADTTDVNYAAYGRYGFVSTISVTASTPSTIFAPNQTTGATWLITVNDNSGAASRYGQVLMTDKGFNSNGQIVNEITAAGMTFAISGNTLSITPTFTGSVKVHVFRLT